MFLRATALFLILFATLSSAAPAPLKTLKLDPKRTISLVGEVTMDQVGRVMSLAMMALESKEPVNILIDSPGGAVAGGEILMEAMRKLTSHGVVVRCITQNAMSMAMYLQTECSERYAMPNSQFLWHPVRASGFDRLTAEEAQQVADELKVLDEKYNGPMQDALGMDDEPYWAAWKAEKVWPAAELMKAAPEFMTQIAGTEGVEWPQDEFAGLLRRLFPTPR